MHLTGPFKQFRSVDIQCPNNPLRMSDLWANSSASFLTSRLSKMSWCTWQKATVLSGGCVIVPRSRRRALNDRSAVNELAGHNSNNLIKRSTCGKMDLYTSCVMFCMTVCACCKVVYWFWSENVANCKDRWLGSTSGYCLQTSWFTVPESNIASSCKYDRKPTESLLNFSLSCMTGPKPCVCSRCQHNWSMNYNPCIAARVHLDPAPHGQKVGGQDP